MSWTCLVYRDIVGTNAESFLFHLKNIKTEKRFKKSYYLLKNPWIAWFSGLAELLAWVIDNDCALLDMMQLHAIYATI